MARLVAFILFILTTPLYPILFLVIKLTSRGPFIFKQKRVGKNKKIFTIYKFRTMVENAEKLQSKYKSQNEATGPVFKIKNDPRFTRVGKFLAKTAIDELPQLINIIKDEMAFVGPRPLPVEEASKIPKKYDARFKVLPGMTSEWVIKGAHKLSFDEWMELDCNYVENKNFLKDVKIFFMTIFVIIHSTLKSIMLT